MQRLFKFVAAMPLIAVAYPVLAIVEPIVAPTQQPPAQVVDAIIKSAVPVGPAVEAPKPAEAAAIDAIISNARVIGFGESNHGNSEPLEYRNRLIRYLVEQRRLTAVALESGFAESRQLYDYVLGGTGDPVELLRTGLTHGFGDLRENLELIQWLRAWNRAHPTQQVRLYGIDRSTILSAGPGEKGYGVVLPHIIAYLERTVPAESQAVRQQLQGFAGRFTENDFPGYSAAERQRLDRALAETEALFRTHRATMVRNGSAADYEWAAREAYDAARLPSLFAIWNVDGSDLRKLKDVIEVRDRAMADHVLWVLRREGPHGRVLLFQANGHVAKAPMIGSVMRNFAAQPVLTGIALRQALGRNYRSIATVSSRNRGPNDTGSGSLDRAFAASVRTPVLLPLQAAVRSNWWNQIQSASQGDKRLDDYVPTAAFDGLVYFKTLTPVVPLHPRKMP